MPDQHREIIKEESFEEGLRALIADPEKAQGFVDGAEALLAENALAGVLADKKEMIWSLAMAPVGGRQVTLYYDFDDGAVYLHYIIAFDE